ncbi:uncharacterized protein [Diadema antillarum]|uniref:uncharacterized protein n=1 Tax=Diadema antillarum TaxID=105358 RepID=UPI003A87880E
MMFGIIGKAPSAFGPIKNGHWNYSELHSAFRCLHSVSAKQTLIRKPPYLSEPQEKKLLTWCQHQVRDMMSESSGPSSSLSPWQQGFYRYFLPMQTRVVDTDWFGHINNAVYYSYFDTIINHYIFRRCKLGAPNQESQSPNILGFMVSTKCTYKQPLNYPEAILAGLAVTKMGNSSVTYTVGVFAENTGQGEMTAEPDKEPSIRGNIMESSEVAHFGSHQDIASAVGQCVHVFVDLKGDQRPVSIPHAARHHFQKILVPFDSDISKL